MTPDSTKHMDENQINIDFVTNVKNGESQSVAIVVALVVIFLTFVILYFVRKQRNVRRGVLLMGLSDSGKTLLFSQLCHGRNIDTYTSIKQNSADVTVTNKKYLRLLDLPGCERLRAQIFDQFKAAARGIIYVIDSTTIQKDVCDAAAFLYMVLTDQVISSYCPPLLILCNKQDVAIAKGPLVIQKQLEKEINTLRVTRARRLQETLIAANNNTFLGKKDVAFEFAHLAPIKVELVEGSAKKGDLEAVQDWLKKIS